MGWTTGVTPNQGHFWVEINTVGLEVIADRQLTLVDHHDDPLGAGVNGLVNGELQNGAVVDVQKLFWHHLGRRQKTRSRPGRGNDDGANMNGGHLLLGMTGQHSVFLACSEAPTVPMLGSAISTHNPGRSFHDRSRSTTHSGGLVPDPACAGQRDVPPWHGAATLPRQDSIHKTKTNGNEPHSRKFY